MVPPVPPVARVFPPKLKATKATESPGPIMLPVKDGG